MTSVSIFLMFVVLRESLALLLKMFRVHQAFLGGFETDEAKLFLQLGGSKFLQYWIGYAAPAAGNRPKRIFFWRRWRR